MGRRGAQATLPRDPRQDRQDRRLAIRYRGQGVEEQQGNRRVEPEDLRAPRQVQATTAPTSANERRPDVEGAPWQQAQGQHGLARQPQECQALNNTLTYRFEKKK